MLSTCSFEVFYNYLLDSLPFSPVSRLFICQKKTIIFKYNDTLSTLIQDEMPQLTSVLRDNQEIEFLKEHDIINSCF
jgi:5'(3')-deoxyribonucleotidase